jgi:hypothetical protein
MGATELIDMRLTRKRPLHSIVVTDCPPISRLSREAGCHVLFVERGAYDFTCVRNLPVLVWCLSEAWTIQGDQLGLIESIAQARPSSLQVMSWDAVKAFPEEFKRAA